MKQVASVLVLLGFVLLPVVVGGLSGFATASGLGSWYAGLVKPSFNPPSWVFGPVWTALYLLMGLSAWRVFRTFDGFGAFMASPAAGVYLAQLALNFAWSFLFFGVRRPDWALGEILVLWIAILAMIRLFWIRDPLAGWLQAPYLCWVSFASVLNGAIWWLNR